MGRYRGSTHTLRRRLSVLAIGIAALALMVGAFLNVAGAEEVGETTAPSGEVTTPPSEPTVAPEETAPVEPPAEEATPPAEETPSEPPAEEAAPPVEEPTTLPAYDGDEPAAKTSSSGSETSAPALTSAKPVDPVVPAAALNIPLNNSTADPGTDCPDDGKTYWHFVISPNNNHSKFVTFHLNLGDGIHDISTFVPNGSQLDNVFVEVPAGYTLTSLVKTGSPA